MRSQAKRCRAILKDIDEATATTQLREYAMQLKRKSPAGHTGRSSAREIARQSGEPRSMAIGVSGRLRSPRPSGAR
jgi:hypothetical protein